MPAMVDRTTMIAQKANVFFTPMIPTRTSMLGRERAGPARSRARAGPLPIPAPMKTLQDGDLGKGREIHERPGYRGKQIGPEGIPAHQAVDVVLGNQCIMSWSTQHETRPPAPLRQQGKNLLHEPPCGLNPGQPFIFPEPTLEHERKNNQQERL